MNSTLHLGNSEPVQQDCLPCKLSGFAVGVGGGYVALRKAMEIQKMGGPRNKAVALGVTGVLLSSAGLYRLLFYRP